MKQSSLHTTTPFSQPQSIPLEGGSDLGETFSPTVEYSPTLAISFTSTYTLTPTWTFTPTPLPPTSTFTPTPLPHTLTFTPSATFIYPPTSTPTVSLTPSPPMTIEISPTYNAEAAAFTPAPALPTEAVTPLFKTPLPLLNWVKPPGTMCSPIEGFSLRELPSIVSSPYNPPPPGSDARHQGVDFAFYRNQGQLTIEGKKVYAVLPGKVIGVVENRLPYGNTIVIETRYSDITAPLAEALSITRDTSLYHLYAHLQDAPLLALGQRVKCGDLIGHVGKSGTIVPHLHFETRMGPAGGWLPSMGYFDEDATEEEKANYLFWRISGVYKHFDPMSLFERYLAYESKNHINLGGE